jgi:hypothetical protein
MFFFRIRFFVKKLLTVDVLCCGFKTVKLLKTVTLKTVTLKTVTLLEATSTEVCAEKTALSSTLTPPSTSQITSP